MSFQIFSPLRFIFLILVKIQLSLSNPNLYYEACQQTFSCGNITAGYPFSVCGHPDLKLICEDDSTTTMMINKVNYHVLSLDEKAKVLKIARGDYSEVICQPNFTSTSLNSVLFENFDDYKSITVLFGCPPPPSATQPNFRHFKCSTIGATYETDGYIREGVYHPGKCKGGLTLPVPKNSIPRTMDDLERVVREGFEVRWKVNGMECEECLKSKGSCGTDPRWHQTICYCPNGHYGPHKCSGSSFNQGKNIAIGIEAIVVGILVSVSIFLISGRGKKFTLDKVLIFCEKKTENDQNMESFIRHCGSLAPKRYTYYEVKKMTKSFNNKLGHGGYGDVYKGKLPDDRLVAVKVLKASKGKGEEFVNELASISRTSHINIVAFLGFCYERKIKALIYEFMPNGSLDKFIYDQDPSSMNRKLEWETIYQIAVGIARGLEYLHRGCSIRIVHLDIKPHNILLDEDFCPKISDFGLAKQSNKKESTISMLDARGTIGYIAPEVFYRNFGGVSYKSDVYSYGMMILEMVGGRKNINAKVSGTSEIYFPDSIYKHLERGQDFELHGVITEEEEEMAKKMILVSLWCIQTYPSNRPSMSKVVEMLEGSPENLQIPPKPRWSSPPRSPKHSYTTASSTEVVSQEPCIKLSGRSHN